MSSKKKKKSAYHDQISEAFVEHIKENVFKQSKLHIRDLKLTERQKEFVKIAFDKNTKIIFVNAPAGVGKTLLSVYCGLHMLNANPKLEIKYIRTIAESGDRGLGSLPGTVDEKFDPFMMPLRDKLDELLPISEAKKLEEEKLIEAIPVNYLRGASWKDKIVIADECFEDTVYIDTDHGRVKFKEIIKNPNDYKVVSFNEASGHFVYNKILNVVDMGMRYISEIELSTGGTIRATKNHKFLTTKGWKKLEDLDFGDLIVCARKGQVKSTRFVTKVTIDIYENCVWDMEVENDHNFIVSCNNLDDRTQLVAHNCQNFSLKEAITMLTRIGENTKMFICGDSMQSDIGSKSGFMKIFQAFDSEDCKEKGIHCFQFTEEDIMRSEILKFIVKKINGITS